ncbi:hypothetical protein [Pseudoalteromonas sp. BDTF-M6]|uniref:hypothetical protein n=1 Tax=Pseudoalteromonas sp. BDTF-M6 TaxID=2796132 RepID=UPI001BAF6F97|nr:hypothetical protein [Pseudoalteromonas sp. BDTF-M6]MBS3796311.1 hypothetical protein [Pseudoalteromonas sp. BDTF-M6]
MMKNSLALGMLGLAILISGCSSFQTTSVQQTQRVAMPAKPSLSERTYVLEYQVDHQQPRVKSVQLPAHPVRRGQSVVIESEQVALTDRLRNRLVAIFNDKALTVISDAKQADYILSINQLDISEADKVDYRLSNSHILGDERLMEEFAQQECSNISGSVSMKLFHRDSKDVVWFAKSSLDTASFQRNPLRYQLTITDYIDNLQQVQEFVQTHNSPDALAKRGEKPAPKAPQYKVVSKTSALEKVAGACNDTEVSALVPDLHYYLSGILLEKININ